MPTYTATLGPWTATWHGSRLADVHHVDCDGAISCFEVDGWSWSAGTNAWSEPERQGLLERELAEWVREDGDTYLENEVRYRRRGPRVRVVRASDIAKEGGRLDARHYIENEIGDDA